MLPRPAHVWGGIALGVTLLDYWCDQGEPNGDTLSEQTRRLFHTDTPLGKAAFALFLAGGVRVLYPHIVDGPMPGSSFST